MNDGDVIRLQVGVGILLVGFGVAAIRGGLSGVAEFFSAATVEVIIFAGLVAFWLLVGRR